MMRRWGPLPPCFASPAVRALWLLWLFTLGSACQIDHPLGSTGLSPPVLLTLPEPLAEWAAADVNGDAAADLLFLTQPGRSPRLLCLLLGGPRLDLQAATCFPVQDASHSLVVLQRAANPPIVLLAGVPIQSWTWQTGQFRAQPTLPIADLSDELLSLPRGLGQDDDLALLFADRRTLAVVSQPLALLTQPTRYLYPQPVTRLWATQPSLGAAQGLFALTGGQLVLETLAGRQALPACAPLDRLADLLLFDLDGDGQPQILQRLQDPSETAVLRRIAPRTWGCDPVLRVPVPHPAALAAADLDGDGTADLLALGGASHDQLLIWQSPFRAGRPVSFSLPLPALALILADLSGDGRSDVLVRVSDTQLLYFSSVFQKASAAPADDLYM